MKHLIPAAAFAALFLAACGAPGDGEPALDAPAPPAETPAEGTSDIAPPSDDGAEAASLSLSAGEHCYFRDDEITTESLRITVGEDGSISGYNLGNIHQEEQAYYAAFNIDLTDGAVGEDGLVTFDSVTEVDGDTQTGPMTWLLTPESASPEGFLDKPLEQAECEGLEDRVFPPL